MEFNNDTYSTSLIKKEILPCENCPEILYNSDNKIKLGKGNAYAKHIYVIGNNHFPKVNLIENFEKLYNDCFHVDVYEMNYVTLFPKCNNKELIKKRIFNKKVSHCKDFLVAELHHICQNFEKIILINCDYIENCLKYVFIDKPIDKLENLEKYPKNKEELMKQLYELTYE